MQKRLPFLNKKQLRTYVDGLGGFVGQKRGVPEVGGFLLALAPLAPGRHNIGVPIEAGVFS